MTPYRILRHPDGTVQAVKDGFSWPGFFFGGFWLLYHRMWVIGSTALLVGGLLYILFPSVQGYVLGVPYGYRPWLADGINLIFCIAIGMLGNAWRLDALGRRGFDVVEFVEADSPDGARAIHLRSKATVTSDG